MIASIDELVQSVYLAFDKDLMLSRKHAGTKNLSSIVFYNEDNQLGRVFLAWPDAKTKRGESEIPIHSHPYVQTIKKVFGEIEFCRYNFTSSPSARSILLKDWEYSYNLDIFSFNGVSYFDEDVDKRPTQTLPSISLHNVFATPPAVWLVEEGRKINNVVRMLVNSDLPNNKGLFEKFESPEQVREHVYEFCSLIQKPVDSVYSGSNSR